ncbi:MAG: hypothetical protein HOO97_03235 [Sideroxydans sp.]|nr:hypothetical protein [Sideroxydans sp.]
MIKPICWEIAGSPYESSALTKSKTFTSGKHALCIIDQFNGRQPYLIDEKLSPSLQFKLIPTIILDSQVASALHSYRTSPATTPRSQINSTIKLLWFLAKSNWDYNPFFYCLESASKSYDYKKYLNGVTPTIRSIIELQLMNDEKLRRENTFEIDQKKMRSFLSSKGFCSILDAAEKRAQYYWEQTQEAGYITQLQFSYAVLLKIALIKNQSKQPAFKKIEKLLLFMRRELGCVLAREFHLAYYYFAGSLPRLIIVEKNILFEDVKKNLLATTWDIFLLRLPELLLSSVTNDEVVIGYPCTAEKDLKKLGALFNIERVILPQDIPILLPAIGNIFLPQVRNALGLPNGASFDEFVQKQETEISESAHNRKPISVRRLQKLIDRLEVELLGICKWDPADTICL